MKNLRHKEGIVRAKKETTIDDGSKLYSDSDAAKNVAWLKSTVVNEKNMALIKEKIKSTHPYRKKC